MANMKKRKYLSNKTYDTYVIGNEMLVPQDEFYKYEYRTAKRIVDAMIFKSPGPE